MSEPTDPQADPAEQAARAAIFAAAAAGDAEAIKRLTKEEQMALYEKSLKEDDWGHQPC